MPVCRVNKAHRRRQASEMIIRQGVNVLVVREHHGRRQGVCGGRRIGKRFDVRSANNTHT